jgi:hypothetical protein
VSIVYLQALLILTDRNLGVACIASFDLSRHRNETRYMNFSNK